MYLGWGGGFSQGGGIFPQGEWAAPLHPLMLVSPSGVSGAQEVRPGLAPSTDWRGARGRGNHEAVQNQKPWSVPRILLPVVVENPGFGLQAEGCCCSWWGAPD